MKINEIKKLLDEYYDYFNRPSFIETDPIQIPHLFKKPEDIEISAFLTATIAWGQRPVIIQNAKYLLDCMPDGPYEFLLQADETRFDFFSTFRHRTFNGTDCIFFLQSLKNIYENHNGLQGVFEEGYRLYRNIPDSIMHFRNVFFSIPFPHRTLKHIADISKNASAKRLNLFLRWMVRKDDRGVDFGIWNSIRPSQLYCPLDIHTGNVARKLGLVTRQQNDWKALEELMLHLRAFDPEDPVKYDFALFGLGIFEDF